LPSHFQIINNSRRQYVIKNLVLDAIGSLKISWALDTPIFLLSKAEIEEQNEVLRCLQRKRSPALNTRGISIHIKFADLKRARARTALTTGQRESARLARRTPLGELRLTATSSPIKE
jgi:hypothetical protein